MSFRATLTLNAAKQKESRGTCICLSPAPSTTLSAQFMRRSLRCMRGKPDLSRHQPILDDPYLHSQ